MIFRVEAAYVLPGVTDAGVKLQVLEAGRPEHCKVIAELKGPPRSLFIVLGGLCATAYHSFIQVASAGPFSDMLVFRASTLLFYEKSVNQIETP